MSLIRNFSPSFSFQSFIPVDELSNGATAALNSSIESTTRRISRRNDKTSYTQPSTTIITTKPSFERTNNYTESRDKTSSNKINRKQQRFNTNHHTQQTTIQPQTHIINPRSKSLAFINLFIYFNEIKRIYSY